MTTPQLIEWLEQQDGRRTRSASWSRLRMCSPPSSTSASRRRCAPTLTERILREADLDGQVEAAIKKIEKPTAADLAKGIKASFEQKADREWRDHIEAEAKKRTLKI